MKPLVAGLSLLALCGCATVRELAQQGRVVDAWGLACNQVLEDASPTGTGTLRPDDRDALRAALDKRTGFALQARVTDQAPFFSPLGPAILGKPALVVQQSFAATAYPGSGLILVPRLRTSGGSHVAWRGRDVWTYSGLSPGQAGTANPRYNTLGALGDLTIGLLTLGTVDLQFRGTSSILPEVTGGSPSVGTPAQLAALEAIAGAGPHCVARLGQACDSLLLLAPGEPSSSPEELFAIDLGTIGPGDGEALELRVIHAAPPGDSLVCGFSYSIAVPLPEGATLAERVQAAIATVAHREAGDRDASPPRVQALSGLEACRQSNAFEGYGGSFAEHRDRRESLRALRRTFVVQLGARVTTLQEVNASLGAPLLAGELVPIAIEAAAQGPGLQRWELDLAVRYDGSLWKSATPAAGEHDVLRLLLGSKTALPATLGVTTRSAVKDAPFEEKVKNAAWRLQALDSGCRYASPGPCAATLPLGRVGPSLGPDEVLVSERLTVGVGDDCSFNVTHAFALPPGATLADRLTRLFAAGLPLDATEIE